MGTEKGEVGKVRMKTKHLETYRNPRPRPGQRQKGLKKKGGRWGQAYWLTKQESNREPEKQRSQD